MIEGNVYHRVPEPENDIDFSDENIEENESQSEIVQKDKK